MFKRNTILTILILFVTTVKGITNLNPPNEFTQAEDTLQSLLTAIKLEEDYTKRVELSSKFDSLLFLVLSKDNSFEHPFDSLKNIGILRSNDGKLKIFNWNIPLLAGQHKYFGYIQLKHNDTVKLYTLNDKRSEIGDPQMEINGPEKWFGALYYQIEDIKFNGKTWYILLGIDFNNLFSSKRVIEVISINENEELAFGASIFLIRNQIINRVIFEYSARAKMMLQFSDEHDMIIFDHLSPSRPEFFGNYQFYGPDFMYDGFKFENGIWNYQSDIDIRNPLRETPQTTTKPPEENPEPGFLYRSNVEVRKELENKEKN